MRRSEILAKFDEIVEFSEIEKFLDTPVKFYSSGMYVRLAFAIAAHLEPDILIVDEVLAVGDQAFQQKSLGKMSSVARSGRTVVFVSHNMGAVLDLCTHGALLEQGRLLRTGAIEDVVAAYVERSLDRGDGRFRRTPFDPATNVISAAALRADGEETDVFDYGSPLAYARDGAAARRVRGRAEDQELAPPAGRICLELGRPRGRVRRATRSRSRSRAPVRRGHLLRRLRLPAAAGKARRQLVGRVSFRVVNARPGISTVSVQASDQLGAVVLEA